MEVKQAAEQCMSRANGSQQPGGDSLYCHPKQALLVRRCPVRRPRRVTARTHSHTQQQACGDAHGRSEYESLSAVGVATSRPLCSVAAPPCIERARRGGWRCPSRHMRCTVRARRVPLRSARHPATAMTPKTRGKGDTVMCGSHARACVLVVFEACVS